MDINMSGQRKGKRYSLNTTPILAILLFSVFYARCSLEIGVIHAIREVFSSLAPQLRQKPTFIHIDFTVKIGSQQSITAPL